MFASKTPQDHVQHNEPNPFLSAFRLDVQMQKPVLSTARCAQLWLKHDIFTRIDPAATKAHVDHARRVLVRLFRFALANTLPTGQTVDLGNEDT